MLKLFVLPFITFFINSNFNAFFDGQFYLTSLNKDWPHVPDPKFPKLPLEYLNSVDPTCQFLLYVGTLTWEVIPDQSIIKFFNGCKRVSRGFCRTNVCPFRSPSTGEICFYKRSLNGGFWIGMGHQRKEKAKCVDPPDFNKNYADIWHSMSKYLSTNYTQNFTTNATTKLPRTFGLPYPLPLPQIFSKEYSEECTHIKAGWNILWQKIPFEPFYTRCNFTTDSGKYCMMREERTDWSKSQNMLLRSTSGWYEITGAKWRDTLLPACQLKP